jgi:hypothetical protein
LLFSLTARRVKAGFVFKKAKTKERKVINEE